MTGRTRACTSATVAGRASRAEQFLEAAEMIGALESSDQDLAAAFVTLCVHAGIAAGDVLCCKRLGHHAQGQDHTESVQLLAKVSRSAARSLDVLLRLKTPAGYSHKPVSAGDRKRAERAAASLVEEMRAG